MKMDEVACSKNDEFYTPSYAIQPIINKLDTDSIRTVWCPFDTSESLFVKMFNNIGLNVEYTHISDGFDFFEYDSNSIPECEVIISNPPYSLKYEVLNRLFEFDKPFAMLVGVVGLFESKKRFEMFKNNDFEIMYFDKRISYFKNYDDQKPSVNPPFSSVYICKNVLDNKIEFEYIDKRNVNNTE